MTTVEIPDKLYFKIGEVSEIVGVEAHVLRFWESEFKVIKPQRASSRQRLYRRADVETIVKIKEMLYGQGFTIAGARKALQEQTKREKAGRLSPEQEADFFSKLKNELLAIKSLLE
ncbi:MAG: MerR family transcriptional regulator [Proteobacteria bacterium]|nr:MerR family transcriptional regulator [Pseudomonadota bacterium]MBU1716755.1 MerR family transcriptional regulator [Pseudomonadota bacterium]